jgi:hypothetical protein
LATQSPSIATTRSGTRLITRYWPALYFVDTDGAIRDRHFGEGRYENSERVIQHLLGVDRELVSVQGVGVEGTERAPRSLVSATGFRLHP